MVELDLKDFHFHFGKSHYEAIFNVFSEVISTKVKDEIIQEDLTSCIESFRDDLMKGFV